MLLFRIASIVVLLCAVTVSNAQDQIPRTREKPKTPDQATSVQGDDLTLDDYNTFYQMILRMRPIGFDLAGFMTNPPSQGGLEAAVRTQECIIRLSGPYTDFANQFSNLATLIGLTAKMIDQQDRALVKAIVATNVKAFLANTGPTVTMITNTTRLPNCSQDGATIAKSQEILRVFKEANGMVQKLAVRLSVSR